MNHASKRTEVTQAREQLLGEIDRQQTAIAAYLPRGVDPERFFALTRRAVADNPDLLECSTNSVLRAIGNCAASGLQLDGKFSSLIVRRPKQGKPSAHWDPTYRGLTYLALESGHVIDVQAGVVREADKFEMELGSDPKLRHVPLLTLKPGAVLAAYAVAKLRSGGQMIELLTRSDIDRIRAMSPAGDKGPWGSWDDEMAKKSAVRRVLKRLPASAIRAAALVETIVNAPSPQSARATRTLLPALPEDEHAIECRALERLNEAGSLDDLQAAWCAVVIDYQQAGLDVPVKIEARRNDRQEALAQYAGE